MDKEVSKAYELDLDALVDEGVKVKFAGAPDGMLEVFPPDVEDFFVLQSIQSKLGKVDSKEFTKEQTEEIMEALRNTLANSIPFVKENGLRFKFTQLLALMGYVMSLAAPAEDKALAALGIEKTGGGEASDPKTESATAN